MEERQGWFVVKCRPARVGASCLREIETTPVERSRNDDRVLRGGAQGKSRGVISLVQTSGSRASISKSLPRGLVSQTN
jgi:hypothetical protein